MKKISLIFFLMYSVSANTSAQFVDWVHQASDAGLSRALGVSSDGTGNLYVAGTLSPTSTLDTITINNLGGFDAYVAKYNRQGDIQWAISFGGSDNDEAFDISTDLSGNSYVTGYVGSNAVIGSQTYSSGYSINFFICKVSATGIIQWAKFFSNPGGLSEGKAIAVNGLGQTLAVTGFLTYSADLDSLSLTGNYEDVFVAKLDPQTGNVLWAHTGGGFSDDEGQGVAIDASGNIIAAGYYKVAATFDTVSFPAGSDHDIFLIKYNSAGNILWAKYAIGPGHDDGYKVKTDSYNNIFMEGLYEDGIDFDGNVLSSAGSFDAYLNKYDENGNLKWILHGGSAGSDYEVFSGFTFDNYGYLWCTGYFNGAAMIDTFHVNTAGEDIVLCRIDTSGQLLNVITYGSNGNDYGYAVAYVPECYIAVAGSFSGTAAFGTYNLTSGGSDDACIVHIDATCTIGIHEIQSEKSLTVFPNPASDALNVNGIEGKTILRIYNALSQCVYEAECTGPFTIPVRNFPDGLYFLKSESEKEIRNAVVEIRN